MINYTKDKIIQEVQKNGISKCQEFLDKDKFKDLEKILINNKQIRIINIFFIKNFPKILRINHLIYL